MVPRLNWVALLVVVVVAAYANSFTAPFVNDDLPAILDNPTLRIAGGAARLFRPPADTTVAGRPLLNASFALNYAISGTAAWSYHLGNLLIHLATALLLFGLVRRTVELRSRGARSHVSADTFESGRKAPPTVPSRAESGSDASSTVLAFFVALLWAVHPLQTEAVTYIVQRAESLMSLCFVLTLYAFVRGVTAEHDSSSSKAPRVRWSVVAVLSCAAGMATKENMVAAPLIVLLYDWTFVSGSLREPWRRHRGTYVALAATWAVLAACLLSTGGNRGGSVGFGAGVSFVAYWLTQIPALARYASLATWPAPLVFDYGTFWVRDVTDIVPALLVVVALGVGVGLAMVRSRVAVFLAAWAGVLLAPTSLMPGTTQMIVEHRMYLALAPVIVAVVFGIHALLGRRAVVAAVGGALALGMLTAARNHTYRSDLALWSDTVAKRPDNAQARFHLATALVTRGRAEEAVGQLRRAVALQPVYAEAQANLGTALLQAGRAAEAVAPLQRAIALNPRLAHTTGNLADALRQSGRIEEAIEVYRKALEREPENARLRANFGNALASAGRLDAARAEYEEALRLAPDVNATRFNYAVVLDGLGRTREAIAELERVLKSDPGFAPAKAALRELKRPR